MGCVSHQRGVAVDQHAKDNAAAEAITDLTEEEMAKLEPGAAASVVSVGHTGITAPPKAPSPS